MGIKCVVCNKEINALKVKHLKLCCKCGKPACKACSTWRNGKLWCKDCAVLSDDRDLVSEYFRDKYASAMRTGGFLLLLLFLLVPAGLSQSISSVSFVDYACEWHDKGGYVTTYVYEDRTILNKTTDKEEVVEVLVDTKVDWEEEWVLNCKQYVQTPKNDFFPELDGFVCTEHDGYAVCDSMIDGNGDGVCHEGGGETCCKISSDGVVCKNGVVKWESADDKEVVISTLRSYR